MTPFLLKFSRNDEEIKSILSPMEGLLGKYQAPYIISYQLLCLQSIFLKLCKNELELLSYRNQCWQTLTCDFLNCLKLL